MADKFLTWSVYSFPGLSPDGMILPAGYIESDYVPTAVRIHADKAPDYADAMFDILDDGVSIFDTHGLNRPATPTMGNATTYPDYPSYPIDTSIALVKDETDDELADNFNHTEIEKGSWITCKINSDGGGRNFTVILELQRVSEADEADE
jgi:hypothetical protein